MKRLYCALVVILVALCGFAETTTVDGIEWTYTLADGKATITRVSESMSGEVLIPDTLDGHPVTSIGWLAFSSQDSITSVVIPDSVTSIDTAFYRCSELVSVSIGNGVKDIAGSAFSGCRSLASIEIHSSVTNIGAMAFYDCRGLKSVSIDSLGAWLGISFGDNTANPLCYAKTLYVNGKVLRRAAIPEDVTSIGAYAFYGYGTLTEVTIPNSVTNIGALAFEGCIGLTSVMLPDSVICIGESAFHNCGGLTSVTMANSVTTIEDGAFGGCYNLPHIAIPDSVTNIGNMLFSSCYNLASVTIPNSVTNIGTSAFDCCYALTNVNLPNTLISIGDSAFAHCSGLTSVTIGNSVTSIGDSAFRGCYGLREVSIQNVATWCGFVFRESSYNPLCYAHNLYIGEEEAYELVIPDGVERIGDFVFYGATNVLSVVIPASVESIGYEAFAGCENLREVYFLGDAPETDGDIFSGASAELKVYAKAGTAGWPASGAAWPADDGDNARPVAVGEDVFVAVTLDANGGTLDGAAAALSVIRGKAVGELPVPTREGLVFDGWWTAAEGGDAVTADTVLENDATLYAHWKKAWDYTIENGEVTITGCYLTDANIIVPATIDGYPVTVIGEFAFSPCWKTVESVVLPDGLQRIGVSPFEDCHNLARVVIPDSVTEIDPSAFEECPKLYASWVKAANGSGGATGQMVALTVTNVVVHYVRESVPSEAVTVPTDTGIVNIISEVNAGAAVAIASDWAAQYAGFEAKFGSDFAKALTATTGKRDGSGRAMQVWQDYVAGTDPTKEDDVFRASITFDAEGKPQIAYSPKFEDAAEAAKRRYRTFGKVRLQDREWAEVPDGAEGDYNFFKVTVEMR